MKLTIDTKEDSHEEIRKAIRMLATIVGDEHIYTNMPPKRHNANIFESSSNTLGESSSEPSSDGGLFNMFGSAPVASEPSEEVEEAKEKTVKHHVIVEY